MQTDNRMWRHEFLSFSCRYIKIDDLLSVQLNFGKNFSHQCFNYDCSFSMASRILVLIREINLAYSF